MSRRQVRMRREYLYRRSLEGKEKVEPSAAKREKGKHPTSEFDPDNT